MAAINSVGMGSGVLTSTVIDQLKANDTTMMVTPIDNKITVNTQKQQALNLLQSLTTSFSASVSSLESSSLYQNRIVSGTTAGVNVTAVSGVALQNFTIANTKLATTDVVQSGAFAASTNPATAGAGKLNLNVNGTDYLINYTASTTYDDLKTLINDTVGADVTASILQTGTSAFSLILNSKNTGQAQQITMTDLTGNLNSTLKTDSLKSAAFATSTTSIATGSGALTLTDGNGIATLFNYSNSPATTLSGLADMINKDPVAGASVHAAVIKNDLGTYNLVLTAKNGTQPITLSDQASGGTLNTNLTTGATTTSGSMSDIQAASDSSFKYNGITLTRTSNTITDITAGMTINLLADASSANISITQDAQPIKDAMQGLTDSYNTLTKQLDAMTTTDPTTNTPGLFNGDNSINGISRDIRNILTSSSSIGQSLTQYGLTLNRDGSMSFSSTDFDTKMAANPDAMANYFSGQTTIDTYGNAHTTDGVFNTLYNNINNLTATNGTLTALSTGLTTDATSLQTNKTNTVALLNSKYATMTSQFIAYDAIMTNMTNQFSSLSQQISAAAAGK